MSVLYPNVQCSNCDYQLELCPDLILDCETPAGCLVPDVSLEVNAALAVRQDLHRLKKMGWLEKDKEKYIKTFHDPDFKVMQLSMLADQIIQDIEEKKAAHNYGKENLKRT